MILSAALDQYERICLEALGSIKTYSSKKFMRKPLGNRIKNLIVQIMLLHMALPRKINFTQMERVKGLLDKLPQEETLLIYSSWDGYYKDPEQVKANPRYKEFRDMFHNIVDIHTSGHADRQTIEKVIKTVNPKEVICIHKEADAEL